MRLNYEGIYSLKLAALQNWSFSGSLHPTQKHPKSTKDPLSSQNQIMDSRNRPNEGLAAATDGTGWKELPLSKPSNSPALALSITTTDCGINDKAKDNAGSDDSSPTASAVEETETDLGEEDISSLANEIELATENALPVPINRRNSTASAIHPSTNMTRTQKAVGMFSLSLSMVLYALDATCVGLLRAERALEASLVPLQ